MEVLGVQNRHRSISRWTASRLAALIACLLGVWMLTGCPDAPTEGGDASAGGPSTSGADEPAVDCNTSASTHGEGIVAVTGEDFKHVVLGSGVPVLVDFWAEWCGPCQMMHPLLEQIADKYEGKALVAKVDVDDPSNRSLATEYGIQSIPAVYLISGGEVVDKWVGYDDGMSQTLSAAIDKAIAGK